MTSKLHASAKSLLAACALLMGCDARSNYKGEGILQDAGPSAEHERYVLDLGPVDVSRPMLQMFRMAGLPEVEFTAGLRPVSTSEACDARSLREVDIRLSVRTEDGSIVVDESGPIGTWIPSSRLLYRRGIERKVVKSGDIVELIRTGSRASSGWGTYFTPHGATTYIMRFEVLEARGLANCASRLVLVGGGWK